jgi:UPF0755 protein
LLKLFKILAATAGAAVLAMAAWLAYYAVQPVPLRAGTIEFSIRQGSGLRQAAWQVAEQGAELGIERFVLLGRILGRSAAIKAGSYEINEGITPLALLDKLTAGDVTLASVVLIEGWTFRQVRDTLDQSPDLLHDSRELRDAEIMKRIGAPGVRPEGWFFPDTYLFGKGSSDISVLRRAYHLMQKNLKSAWDGRDPRTPYASAYEGLIMASIIEKETGQSTERVMIGGVFVNRLRLGMPLQTDPTVIYGLGARFDGNLRKRDLIGDGPYNTYTRAGLPPTPIAMPGLASLTAATNPAKTDMLYFVARGDGSSQFSRTLAEHNRAVQKYQLSGRRR